MTVYDCLRGLNAYPIPAAAIREIAINRGVYVDDEATAELLASTEYIGAKADVLCGWLMLRMCRKVGKIIVLVSLSARRCVLRLLLFTTKWAKMRNRAQSFTAIKVHGYDNREWTYRGEAQKGRWH